jgi:hypothetical protein
MKEDKQTGGTHFNFDRPHHNVFESIHDEQMDRTEGILHYGEGPRSGGGSDKKGNSIENISTGDPFKSIINQL